MEPDEKRPTDKKSPPHPPLKPKHPDTRGAPDDHDPNAQYEDKDES
jgi:hypothetical protein